MTSEEPAGRTFPYSTAQAFGADLTDRLKAAVSPYSVSQLRRQFAYDRLLARLFRDAGTGWVLKGGISMGIAERHGQRPSTRFRDLVDIVLIARSQLVEASALCAALASEGCRRELALPERFDVPDRPLWEAGYRTMAREVPGLAEQTLAAAVIIAQRLFDPVLNGRARGHWDPHSLRWPPFNDMT